MEKVKLYRRIYEDLLQKISSGKYSNGDKLPTEAELTEQYNVSRITAISAMKLLEEQGYVTRMRKLGSFVSFNKNADRNFTIALVLPYSDLLNYDIIRGAQRQGMELGCHIPFFNTKNNVALEHNILKDLLYKKVDAVILYPATSHCNIDLVSRFCLKKIPIVFADRNMAGLDCPVVTSDNRGGMFNLVSELLKRYKRPAYFGLQQSMLLTEAERFEGYCSALLSRGMIIDGKSIFHIPEHIQKSYTVPDTENPQIIAAAKEILLRLRAEKSLPDIVFCTNDCLAYSMTMAATSLNIDIPSTLAVAGFDNTALSERVIPALTAVGQDFHAIGKAAVETAYKLLIGCECPKRIEIATTPVYRKSTAHRVN